MARRGCRVEGRDAGWWYPALGMVNLCLVRSVSKSNAVTEYIYVRFLWYVGGY